MNGLVALMNILDWISLPSLVLVLSYAFLGATIVQTQGDVFSLGNLMCW